MDMLLEATYVEYSYFKRLMKRKRRERKEHKVSVFY